MTYIIVPVEKSKPCNCWDFPLEN